MSERHALRMMFVLWIGFATLVLGGCALNRTFTPEVHKVHKGESLSSIAAQYGLNWHDLARWNHVQPPYTIHVGQRLSLDPFPPLNYDEMRRERRSAVANRHPNKRSTVTAMPANHGPRVTRLPAQNTPSVQATNDTATSAATDESPTSGQPPATGTTEDNTATASETRQSKPAKPVEPPLVNAQGWRWPLAGSVLDSNNAERTRHGMNLYGADGTPIYAARAGQVVYSGVGLQGFGQLVIIKHDDHYLSAYGYVRNVQAEEGDRIEAGQHIADMGAGPGDRAMLHFEVRHDGEPIDPQSVLPKR